MLRPRRDSTLVPPRKTSPRIPPEADGMRKLSTHRFGVGLTAAVLGRGKNSRMYKALVYDARLATAVSVGLEQHELASMFSIGGCGRLKTMAFSRSSMDSAYFSCRK